MKLLHSYIKDRQGATALEFALVAMPLFIGIFATIELSYKSILQSELDNKLYTVASDIAINNHTASNSSEFMQNHFCPNIGTNFLKCDDIEIGVQNVTGLARLRSFRDISVIGQWDLGNTNDALIIEISYPLTNVTHPIAIADVIERNGRDYYRSRGVVRREPLLNSTTP